MESVLLKHDVETYVPNTHKLVSIEHKNRFLFSC